MIRVLIADDQALVRGGFHSILDGQPDIDVIAETEDGPATVEQTLALRPDVVLMDIRMPGIDGIEATRRILDQTTVPVRILVLTTFDVDRYVYEAMRAGASGFLLKTAPPAQLADAVRTVAAGEALLAPTVIRRLVEEFIQRPPPGARPPAAVEELTDRELEVLRLLARALSNAEIAKELVLSEATVKTHVNRILSKLELRDRAQVVVFAYENRLIEPGSPSAR